MHAGQGLLWLAISLPLVASFVGVPCANPAPLKHSTHLPKHALTHGPSGGTCYGGTLRSERSGARTGGAAEASRLALDERWHLSQWLWPPAESIRRAAVGAALGVATTLAAAQVGIGGPSSAWAAFEELQEDGYVVERKIDYACIATRCGGTAISMVRDQRALHELSCLSSCGIDDIACQMRCGDMYPEDVLRDFHVCAIAQHHCVPQRRDIGRHMLPDPASLPKTFEPERFSGEWFITHGLNGIFDCFDCQRHFVKGEPGRMTVDVAYQVARTGGDGGTFTRTLRQTFLQDPAHPGILQAADNGYLHQRDDWFILDADPDSHILVYYTGCNDAWCGYVGGVVYSRTPNLTSETQSRLASISSAFGIKFQDWCGPDNTCALDRGGVAAAAGKSAAAEAAGVPTAAAANGAAGGGGGAALAAVGGPEAAAAAAVVSVEAGGEDFVGLGACGGLSLPQSGVRSGKAVAALSDTVGGGVGGAGRAVAVRGEPPSESDRQVVGWIAS